MIKRKQKDRRESGRVHNKFYDPENGCYNEQYWDDWNDHRDSFRSGRYPDADRKMIKRKSEANNRKIPIMYTLKYHLGEYFDDGFKKIHDNNEKLKRLLNRRKLMKTKNIIYK